MQPLKMALVNASTSSATVLRQAQGPLVGKPAEPAELVEGRQTHQQLTTTHSKATDF